MVFKSGAIGQVVFRQPLENGDPTAPLIAKIAESKMESMTHLCLRQNNNCSRRLA